MPRAADLLYAIRGTFVEENSIKFSFNTAPHTHIEYFADRAQLDLWWEEFVTMMTAYCAPPCLQCGDMLFQPHYLQRIVPYSDHRVHFVVLDFGNNHNLWLGYEEAHKQVALLQDLVAALGPNFKLRSSTLPGV